MEQQEWARAGESGMARMVRTLVVVNDELNRERTRYKKQVEAWKELAQQKDRELVRRMTTEVGTPCPVCFEIKESRSVATPCGHLFCTACLDKLLSCALCTSKINARYRVY